MYIKYHVPTELKASPVTEVNVDRNSNPQRLEVLNGLDPRYCYIQMFVRQGTPFDSLQIDCPRCDITQDTSFPLQINGDLNLNGEVIHANFRDLQVGRLSYTATSGYIQLNNIISPSPDNIINLGEGDVIIQSTQDFQVDVTTETQAFCFNGPTVTQLSSTNCSISGQSNLISLYFPLITY